VSSVSKAARAYITVAAVIGTALLVQTLRQLWSGDVWQHAASISAFRAHPLDPNHPLTVDLVDDPYFLSPWAMVWGTFSRVTGFGPFTALVVSGISNMVLIGVGLYRLAGRVSTARWAPTLALVSLLLLWGPHPWRWSGYPSLNSIGFGLPYPSFLAFGLYLIGLTSMLDLARRTSRAQLLVLFCSTTLAVLCHTLTGLALILSVAAVAAVDRGPRARTMWLAMGAIIAAIAAAAIWPFGHLWDLTGAPAAFDDINRNVNRHLLAGAGCALVAAPWVLWRLEPAVAPRLRAVFGANVLVATIGFLGGPSSAGRLLPFALVPVQIGFAALVANELEAPRRRLLVPVAASLLLLVGLFGARGALPRVVPSQLLPGWLASDDRLESASSRARGVPAIPIDDPVAIASGVDGRLLVANGIRLVSPPYPVATLSADELARRAADSSGYLAASASEQRSIAARYEVDVLVVASDIAVGEHLGPVIASSSTMRVIDVRPPCPTMTPDGTRCRRQPSS
jgi:hypothetical protein